MDQKVINGHKNPSDGHNYHDENHDEIEFYLGNSDRSTWWHSTLEQPSKHDINGPFVVSVKATNGRNGSMASHFLSQMARFSVAICLPFKACHEPAVNGPLKASHFTAI